jgi:hypothetical protein
MCAMGGAASASLDATGRPRDAPRGKRELVLVLRAVMADAGRAGGGAGRGVLRGRRV